MLCACRSAVLASRCCANVGGGGGKPVDWRHALWLATRGGAAALGANVGGFEVGREFDAQLFDVAAGDVTLLHPGFAPPADESAVLARVERFINLGDDRCVKRVWVRGRLVRGVTSASSSWATHLRDAARDAATAAAKDAIAQHFAGCKT